MSNKSFCFLMITIALFSYASGMLVPISQPQMQFLPKDELKEVQLHLNIQILGRMKSVCQYINETINIESILHNPYYSDFKSVEKFLYHHVPKMLILQDDYAQKLRNRYVAMINVHEQKVDSSIEQVYFLIKCGSYGKFFVDNLKLTEDDRMLFYGGKLPGQINLLHDYSSDEELGFIKNDTVLCDVVDAAHEDACYAAKNGNIARLEVVLNRYEQFANFHALLEPLCKLGNSTIVLDYLSIPERGIDYTEEAGSLTALELAAFYENKELENILLEHGA